MRASDRERFKKRIKAVLAVYGEYMDLIAEPLWWEALKSAPWEFVDEACRRWVGRMRKAPTPAGIRGFCPNVRTEREFIQYVEDPAGRKSLYEQYDRYLAWHRERNESDRKRREEWDAFRKEMKTEQENANES